MKEKRRVKRRNPLYQLQVYDQDTDELMGHISDISMQGFMMISPRQLEVNKVYTVKIKLPAEISNKKQVVVTAKSIWCKNDINPSLFSTGFEILDDQNQDTETIAGLFTLYNSP